MAQSGEGKPRVVIAGVGAAAEGIAETVVRPDASIKSEVVEPMRAAVASFLAPFCPAGASAGHNHIGRGAQHGCR